MQRFWQNVVLGGAVTGALVASLAWGPSVPTVRAVETTTDVVLKIGTTDVAVLHHEKIGTTIDCLVVVVKDVQPTVVCPQTTSSTTQ